MPKLRVHNLAMSVDGYVAGPDQGLESPLGVDGTRLHEWVFETRSGREMIGVSRRAATRHSLASTPGQSWSALPTTR